jgi:hypothetical protein
MFNFKKLKSNFNIGSNVFNNNFKPTSPLVNNKTVNKKVLYYDKKGNAPPVQFVKQVYSKLPDDEKVPVEFMTKRQYLQQYIRNQEVKDGIRFNKQEKQQYIRTELKDMRPIVSRFTTYHNPYMPPKVVFFTDSKINKQHFKHNAQHEFGHELYERSPQTRQQWNFTVSKTTSPTSYGRTSVDEDFAESYALYKDKRLQDSKRQQVFNNIKVDQQSKNGLKPNKLQMERIKKLPIYVVEKYDKQGNISGSNPFNKENINIPAQKYMFSLAKQHPGVITEIEQHPNTNVFIDSKGVMRDFQKTTDAYTSEQRKDRLSMKGMQTMDSKNQNLVFLGLDYFDKDDKTKNIDEKTLFHEYKHVDQAKGLTVEEYHKKLDKEEKKYPSYNEYPTEIEANNYMVQKAKERHPFSHYSTDKEFIDMAPLNVTAYNMQKKQNITEGLNALDDAREKQHNYSPEELPFADDTSNNLSVTGRIVNRYAEAKHLPLTKWDLNDIRKRVQERELIQLPTEEEEQNRQGLNVVYNSGSDIRKDMKQAVKKIIGLPNTDVDSQNLKKFFRDSEKFTTKEEAEKHIQEIKDVYPPEQIKKITLKKINESKMFDGYNPPGGLGYSSMGSTKQYNYKVITTTVNKKIDNDKTSKNNSNPKSYIDNHLRPEIMKRWNISEEDADEIIDEIPNYNITPENMWDIIEIEVAKLLKSGTTRR